jgi:plastocyanin
VQRSQAAGPPAVVPRTAHARATRWIEPSAATVSDSGFIGSTAEVHGFGLAPTAASSRWAVSFAGAAKTTYTYVCQIHDGMAGRIVVH